MSNIKELMAQASPLPWSEDPEGIVQVEIESAEGLPVGCAYLSENQAEANSPNATLIVHCVNNFAQVTDALREALTQLDYYNAETRETGRWAEWHSTLAAAQTIPSGESRKCAKCGFNISEYAVGEILCGACLNDQPCALCGHSYEAHEPDMQCHDGEAHGNRCACRTFVPSGEKEGK